ncbi:AraC family transcriptional regulator [Paenibacillus koleovorans]|uniref:AraC family transcriptional regulator n=1 Tax=Paenibacillus koleovorans TaxID=121608 RepID=UPI000FDA6B66|nr:AraC family transcriptional regulator [Paenibacillus koleovorans]
MLQGFLHFKERYTPRSYFFKLFGLISITVMLLIVSLTYFLFGKFSEYSQTSLQSTNKKMLEQISYNIRYTSDYINQLLLTLYTRQESSQLLYAASYDVFTTNLNIINLDQSFASAPFIDTVYIYNANLQQFYVMGSDRYVREPAKLNDPQVVEWTKQPSTVQPLKPIYRQIQGRGASEPHSVFTYVLYDAADRSKPVSRMIVINVKADWILNNIRTMGQNQFGPNSKVVIVDQAGQIAEADSPLPPLTSSQLQNACVPAKVLLGSSTDGNYTCQAGDTDYVATYQAIPDLDWKILVLTTNRFLSHQLHQLRTGTFVISGMLLGVGLLLALLAALFLHFPIRRLKRTISALMNDKQEPVILNELHYVSETVEQLKLSMNSLQSFKSDHQLTLKQELLRKMLVQPMSDMRQLEPIFHQLNVRIPIAGRYCVVLFEVDRLAALKQKRGSEEQWEPIRCSLTTLLERSLSASYRCEGVEVDDRWVCIVETELHQLGREQPAALLQDLRRLQQQLEQELPFTLSVFVSARGDGLDSIGSLFREVEYLSHYRMHYGGGCMLTEVELNGLSEENMQFPRPLVKQLKECLNHGEQEEADRLLQEILHYFKGYSIRNLNFGIHYLLHHVYETISIMDSNSNVTFDLDLIELNQQLGECETLDDVADLFRQLFHSVIVRMDDRKEGKSMQLVEQMKTYIDAHLTDFNLSPNQIASLLHLSTDYVRKLFKKEMSISMAAYINQERVRLIAERMLERGDTLDTLLDEIGWDNKNYFFKLFKDHYGVTPTEYRMAKRHAMNFQDAIPRLATDNAVT